MAERQRPPGRFRYVTSAGPVLLSLVLTCLGLTLITFLIGHVVPIDPVLTIVGDRAPADVYLKVRAELGLDQPLLVQYWRYLEKLLSGDLGISFLTSHPVLQDLIHVFPATLELATVATLIGIAVGMPLGVLAASRSGGMLDGLVRFISLAGTSLPVFWLGIIGLLIFYLRLGWVAGPGRLDLGYAGLVEPRTGLVIVDSLLAGEPAIAANALAHLILPSAVLASYAIALIARMTRSFMLREMAQEYILAARAKGLSRARVVWRHALGNVAAPLVTVIALTYGDLLQGAVVTETVFAWPGLGLYLRNSLFKADMNAILGGTLLVGLIFITLNLVSDLLNRYLDMRTR
jgi:peptide/nickel transport system permease protein